VFCVLVNKDKRPTQDNQDKAVQMKYREREQKQKIPPGARMYVLCVVSERQKHNSQDNQDKDTSTDEIQSTRGYKKSPGRGKSFSLLSKTPDRLWGPLSLPFIGFCGPVLGVEWARVNLTTHILLVPRLRINEAVRLRHLHAFMTWTGTTN
jgi:hypothetical protein